MSRENIEVVVRALGAAVKRPTPDFDTMNALFHEDHKWVPVTSSMLGEASAEGARGYKDWSQQVASLMPFESEIDGAVDLGPATVLVATTNRFRGVSSGADVEQRFWLVVTIAEGKLTSTEAYADPAEALEAVGCGT